ncbi:MAG: tetratricopeptide repeat protein, partial [Planctomycetales bacterium]
MRFPASIVRCYFIVGLTLLASAPLAFNHAQPKAAKDAPKNSQAATRQFAAAAQLQNKQLYDLAIDEWLRFLKKYPTDSRLPLGKHYLGICQLKAAKHEDAVKTFDGVIKTHPKFEKLDETYLNLGVAHYSLGGGGKAESFDAAAKAFAALEAKFADSKYAPQAIYYRGESLYAQGQKEAAVAAYEKFAKNHAGKPLEADALYGLSVTLEELGKPAEAGGYYDSFLKKFPQHAYAGEIQYRRGELLFKDMKFTEAAPFFETASNTKGFGLADYALVRQASCLYQLKKYAESEKLYAALPTRFAESKYIALSQLSQGKCFYLLGDFKNARAALAKVMPPGSHAVEASHWNAKCFLKEGDPAAALKAADTGLAMKESAESPFLVALQLDRADALYENAETRKDAAAAYLGIFDKHPEASEAGEALYMSGFTSLGLGAHEDALARATSFLEKFADNAFAPDVLYIAGESNLQLKDYPKAEGFYRQLVEKHAEHSMAKQASLRLGLSLYLQQKYEDCVTFIDGLLPSTKEPESLAESHHLRGRSFSGLEKYTEAAAALEAALKAKADWRQADETRLVLGHAYSLLKNNPKGVAQFQALIKDFPDSSHLAEANYRLAELLYQGGDYQGAQANYETVAEKHAASSFKPHALYGLGWA